MVVTLSAALHVRDGRSTELQGLSAQLWDEDPLSDDFLAGAPITGSHPDFSTEFTFNLKKASSLIVGATLAQLTHHACVKADELKCLPTRIDSMVHRYFQIQPQLKAYWSSSKYYNSFQCRLLR